MSNQHAAKYRPSLSAVEIRYILDLCNADERQETEKLSTNLSSKLRVFSLKMQLGIVSASHTAAPVTTLEERLGLESMTSADRRSVAYSKYKLNPDYCSVEELKLAHTYRYEHGLMSDSESEEFENGC
jgi:hypothetical protein